MSRPWLTPAQARDLAAQAEQLAQRLETAEAARDVEPDPLRRRAGFRLEAIQGDLRRAAEALLATADDLARHASRPDDPCQVSSGACPEHGATLAESGGEAWCTAPACGRRWGYRRLTMPCTESVAFRARFASGTDAPVCAGHAVEAAARGGATLTPLDQQEGM